MTSMDWIIDHVFVNDPLCIALHLVQRNESLCMAQACLTNYFTPKRSARSTTLTKSQSEKRKLIHDDENIENICAKKRRISPSKPTDGYLPGCDLDQIEKKPLTRKNKIDVNVNQCKSFDRQKQRLADVVDLNELRGHLQAVRTHLDQVNKDITSTPSKPSSPAHQRFAHLLVSPANLRQNDQDRLKKVLSKVDPSIIESLPSTPSKKITGVNNRLLEQIRLKEESRVQLQTLTTTGLIPDETNRMKTKEMFGHLTESIEIIDQLFTTERQVALELDRIREKLMELHSTRLDNDRANEWMEFVLQQMNECFQGYLLRIKLRNKEYLKINRMKFDGKIFKQFIQNKLIEFGD